MQLREIPISSPLNYTGGKYKLLSQIFPILPNEINTFVDIFCGGCNVGVNVSAQHVICNDSNSKLIGLYNYLKNTDVESFLNQIYQTIEKFNLSNSSENGYLFYGCNSAKGLGSYNKSGFLKLREDYNNLNENDDLFFVKLYVLIVYAFNNQIRFNREGNFNLPVGKRDFNRRMKNKLELFINNIKDIEFTNNEFSDFSVERLGKNDFVYADPPYLITCASYNELDGWNESQEYALLRFLDELNNRDIRFALSNVLIAKGKKNEILDNWLNKNPNYICHHLEFTYRNSNYQRKNKTDSDDEVLITNY